MNTTLQTGAWGEDKAAEYLIQNGYIIHARNYRHRHAEIDLIAEKDGTLVFVEVKTRRWVSYGLPESFVSRSKVQLIKNAAEHYIFAEDWLCDVRFDIISILIGENGSFQVYQVEDAFY